MSSITAAHSHKSGPRNVLSPCKHKDSFDVIADYASEQPYRFAKALYVLGIDIPRIWGILAQDNAIASLLKKRLSLFKLSSGPAKVLKSMRSTVLSSWSYLYAQPVKLGRDKEASVQSLSRVIREGLGVLSPVHDIAMFFTKAILFIPKGSIRTLGGLSGIALSILMG